MNDISFKDKLLQHFGFLMHLYQLKLLRFQFAYLCNKLEKVKDFRYILLRIYQ